MLKNHCDYRRVENTLKKIHMINMYTETPQWPILSIFLSIFRKKKKSVKILGILVKDYTGLI